jgi:hypothetical protein
VNIATIGLIAAAAWISLLIVVVALCRAAAHADHRDDRLAASLF